jgi:hypothetical protein
MASTTTKTFGTVHRQYVQSLYKRRLKNSLDWTIRRDVWRGKAMQIRAEFERNRLVGLSRSGHQLTRRISGT